MKEMIGTKPLKKFSCTNTEYSERWWEDCIDNAHSNLARDEAGNLLPHCMTLNLFGSKHSKTDYFKLELKAKYKAIVFVFSTNEEMESWIECQGNPDIIVHKVKI